MYKRIFFNWNFITSYMLIIMYISTFSILFKLNIVSYKQLQQGLFDNFVIMYFYLPISIVLILGHVSRYKNFMIVIRDYKKIFINIIKNFNLLNMLMWLSILLLVSFLDIFRGIHLIINVIAISNIFLLIVILVNFFTDIKLLRALPIILYANEILMFQKFRMSIFNYYNMPILYSIPIYLVISLTLLFAIKILYEVRDIIV